MAKKLDMEARRPKLETGGGRSHISRAAYVLLILFLLTVAMGGIYARYVYSTGNNGTVMAKEFYFTSDQLSKSGSPYTLSAGTTSVTINVKNYADVYRMSGEEITYTVTADNGATVGVLPGDGKLAGNTQASADVVISGLQDGKTYTVTATGVAGYRETLTATFTVLEAAGVYKYLDISNPAYVVLTVWTENVAGNASITFPAGLIPDATDPALSAIYNYNSSGDPYQYESANFSDGGSFVLPYSSHSYRFFKENVATAYALNGFTKVTVNGVDAQEAIP